MKKTTLANLTLSNFFYYCVTNVKLFDWMNLLKVVLNTLTLTFEWFFLLIMKWKFKQMGYNSTNINKANNHLIKYSYAKVHLDMTSNLVLPIIRVGAYCIVTRHFNQIAKLYNLL